MKGLSDRQQHMLRYISDYSRDYGYPPTVREIAERFRFTPRAAFDHLRALERGGDRKGRPDAHDARLHAGAPDGLQQIEEDGRRQ